MKTKLLSALVLLSALLAGTAHADTHTWTGLGGDDKWTTIANWSANYRPYDTESVPIVLIFPAGAARLSNTCNIPNLTIQSFIINGSNYSIDSSAANISITLVNPGVGLYSAGTGNKIYIPFILGSPVINIGIPSGKELQVFGALTGSGGFEKTGPGKLYLAGSPDNLFTGTLTVNRGEVHLNKDSGHLAFSGPLVIGDTLGPAGTSGGSDQPPFPRPPVRSIGRFRSLPPKANS